MVQGPRDGAWCLVGAFVRVPSSWAQRLQRSAASQALRTLQCWGCVLGLFITLSASMKLSGCPGKQWDSV